MYYLPHATRWPILACIGLFTLMLGASMWLNEASSGAWLVLAGSVVLTVMVFGWFGAVIAEDQRGLYDLQVDRSFRWAMSWFILSEIMFFAGFFGALLYARQFVVPWLAGEGTNFFTNLLLWQGFENTWPSAGPAGAGDGFEAMEAWGIPALNTAILVSSGVTVNVAHHMLLAGRRAGLVLWLAATFVLGIVFLGLQASEYAHAYTDLDLRLETGIYGTTFFMLTGFHGLHVALGTIMLIVIWLRVVRGHFSRQRHFAFEAVAWYWHFVDVVWLFLFVFVYWL